MVASAKPPSRRNTFQQMLDLEQMNKFQRLQTLPNASDPSIPDGVARARGHPGIRRPTLESIPRAMTTPSLTLQIPPMDISTTNRLTSSGDSSHPHHSANQADDEESDTTSICRSPAWEDAEKKAERRCREDAKEKRKKAKQKAETEAKYTQKVNNRLKKPPPTNPQLDKLEHVKHGSSSDLNLVSGDEKINRRNSGSTLGRSRRGSIELGLAKLKSATQALTGSWKSSQSSPTVDQETVDTGGGFMGGLKLRIVQQAGVKEQLQAYPPSASQEDHGAERCRDAAALSCRQQSETMSASSLLARPSEFSKSVSGFSWVEGASVIEQPLNQVSQRSMSSQEGVRLPVQAPVQASSSTLQRRHAKRYSTDRFQGTTVFSSNSMEHDPAIEPKEPLFKRNSVKGLKIAAKAAFARHPHTANPSTAVPNRPHETASSSRADRGFLETLKISGSLASSGSGCSPRSSHMTGSLTTLPPSTTSLQQSSSISMNEKGFNYGSDRCLKVAENNTKYASKPKTTIDKAAAESSEESYMCDTSSMTTPISSRPESEIEYSKENVRMVSVQHPNVTLLGSKSLKTPALIPTEQPRTPRTSKIPQPKPQIATSTSTALPRHPSISQSRPPIQPDDLSFLPLQETQAHHTGPSKGRQGSPIDKKQEFFQNHRTIKDPPSSSTSDKLPTVTRNDSLVLRRQKGNSEPCAHYSTPSISQLQPTHNAISTRIKEPVAKMFVICCSCRYFHDMPSKIYQCMAEPDVMVKDTELGVSGIVSTTVKCPWCGHGMSTSCCTGWASVVYLNERLH